MAEPFAKPTKEMIEEARELYGDPILYWATNTAVEVLKRMNPNDFDIQENQFGEWLFLTRRLLWKFGLNQIVGNVYRLAEEDAEEYWKNWTPPKVAGDFKEVSIDPTAKTLSGKIKITDIAKKYEIKVKKGKAFCPFHEGNSPSLSLSDSKGVFHCFGCKSKGDLITFVRLLEDLK